MEKKLILIGTGGRNIGFGHVSRLKNIQNFFEKKDFDCHLLVNDDSSLRNFVLTNVSFFDLKDVKLEDYDLLGNIIIIDSYIIPDRQFQKAFYVRIDDFCHLPHYSADIIVNPNFGSEKFSKCYLEKVSKDVKLLLGGENVILHPDYLLPTTHIEHGKIAIFLGANDGGCVKQLLTLLQLCEENKNVKEIAIIITENYDISIKDYIGPKTTIYQGLKSLFPVIKDAEWGISSAGVTKYEFAALGIPVLVFALIEHQIGIGIDFEERGFGIYGGILKELDKKQLRKVLSKLLPSLQRQKQFEGQIHFKGNQNLYNEIVLL